MSTKKTTASKTSARKLARAAIAKAQASQKKTGKVVGKTGYKGHRPGSMKEAIHKLFDTHGADKAYPMACKLVAESTVNTSFSQFRALRDKK